MTSNALNARIKSGSIDGAEISWFAPICDGDDEFLGERDPTFKSNWTHTSAIVRAADRLGYRNILLPSSFQVGQDTLSFASAVAPQTSNINLLTAIRCGEIHPPMLARALSTLDHILEGRLTVNIISSDLPGHNLPSPDRYRRSEEVIEILKQCWYQDQLKFEGEFYKFDLPTAPVRPYQQNGGPLLYFGGYSPHGLDLCAKHCDVYLMWPNTRLGLQRQIALMADKAAVYNREIDFGLRIHVIVRETEAEARAYAKRLMSKLDDKLGVEIRERAQDAQSAGVNQQTALREQSDSEGYIEENLWTGIGRARSGCGAALVGDPDQIVDAIRIYQEMGFRSFIFSGYPHMDECHLFARYVMPQLNTISLPKVYGRQPVSVPNTPLGKGERF